MTDTAQPLPDEIEPVEESALTPEQQRRAAALTKARFILAANGGIFGGQKLGERFTVQDLLTVGDYILGVGPFTSLEAIGAASEGTELPAGLEHVATFYPNPPKSSNALDDPPGSDADDDPPGSDADDDPPGSDAAVLPGGLVPAMNFLRT